MAEKPLAKRLGEPQFEPLTLERERELGARLKRAKTDEERKAVRDEIILAHMRLVMHIGRGYENRLPQDEIMSVGALALSQAAEKWDPDKGSIYQWSRRWITTALTKATDAARTIRVPEAVANEAALLARRIADIESALGRRLTQRERDEVVGTSHTFETLPTVSKSIDERLSDDTAPRDASRAVSIDEMLEDIDTQTPEQYVEHQDMAANLQRAMQELDEIEREVVLIRFGFTDSDRTTLAALGKKYDVSAEAMRRIEMSALAKLRHPALSVNLDGFV